MQWQGKYCPACRPRVDAGETVRDLLLGHAENCIAAVHSVAAELGRPVRPLMWADEFYMYGPGKDWVGIERIPHDTVMGYWKYWSDYAGIAGLLERGYDVLGISAMYNHTFYLADLSPDQPPKRWPPMEQTGVRNIAAMLCQAAGERQDPASASSGARRPLRFPSIACALSIPSGTDSPSTAMRPGANPQLALEDYQEDFTKAFTRHFYDARTDAAADALAASVRAPGSLQVCSRTCQPDAGRCCRRGGYPRARLRREHVDGGVPPLCHIDVRR